MYELHSHQQCVRIPVSPHLQKLLILSVIFTLLIWFGVKRYLTRVFLWITHDIKHLFMAYFPSMYLLWWSICSNILPIFKIRLYSINITENSFILDINLLWDIYALWIFFFLQSTAFSFLIGVLQRAKGFNFDEVQDMIFSYGLCFSCPI